MAKRHSRKLVSKAVGKKILDKNVEALRIYDRYKKTSDLIERANVALGKKPTFKTGTGSTLNFKINYYGVSSTTSQKI